MRRVILIRIWKLVSSGVSTSGVGGHWGISIDVGVNWGDFGVLFYWLKCFITLPLLYDSTIP
jgi:hypothetical protein